MFGEVFDANPQFMSQYTTDGQAPGDRRLRLPVRRRGLRRGQSRRRACATCSRSDDWYTDADSNAYSLPDIPRQPRHGPHRQVHRQRRASRGASAAGARRARPLAHVPDARSAGRLLRRRAGLRRRRRRPGRPRGHVRRQVASYNDDDLIGTDATTARTRTSTPATRCTSPSRGLAELRDEHPALADGAQVHRFASDGAGIFAFSRIEPTSSVEYVVAANNADDDRRPRRSTTFAPRADVAAWSGRPTLTTCGQLRTDADGQVTVTGAAAVGRRSTGRPSRSRADGVGAGAVVQTPRRRRRGRRSRRDRCRRAGGDFNQVTFAYRPVGGDEWTVLGTDDNAPYRVFHDVAGMRQGHAAGVPRRRRGPRR